MNSEKSPHSGHRARIKKKFLDFGLDVFAEHEVLELLLFFAIPRGDVNELAHRLIDQFGSLTGVMRASPAALKCVEGIGENTALLINLLAQLERRVLIERSGKTDGVKIRNSDDAGKILAPYFTGSSSEEFYIMTLTASGQVIKCRKIQEGSITELPIDFRKLISAAFDDGAAALIVAHNHPSGIALPSRSDIETTARIKEALMLVGIKLADHIIVSGDDWVSLKDSGLIKS